MHDLIRDMALKILSEESMVMVEAGKELTECPDADEWKHRLFRVSLMNNEIREIGSDDWRPICPNLSTLLLSRNHRLVKISDSFFERLDGLKVLDLSYTSIQRLPGSISNLVSLSALLLQYCGKLEHIPSLVKLKALEKLDLLGCGKIDKIPHGVEFLHKLRYLDLRDCYQLKEFPTGILTKLSRLQVLKIEMKLRLETEEVGCLEKPKDLSCCFSNLADFNKYLGFAKSLYAFHIYVMYRKMNNRFLRILKSDERMTVEVFGWTYRIILTFSNCRTDAGGLSDSALDTIELPEWIASKSGLAADIFSTLDKILIKCLSNGGNRGPLPLALPFTEIFACLRSITISDCHNMKKLFPRDLLLNLQNLEHIFVWGCDGLEEIVTSTEESSSDYPSHSVTLPQLRGLKLFHLPRLQSIYSGKLICESLQTLRLLDCGMLKRIPISLPLPSISEIKVGPRDWWEQVVEWDHPHAKQTLQPWLEFPW